MLASGVHAPWGGRRWLRRAVALLVLGVLAGCALAPRRAAAPPGADPEFTLAWAGYFVPHQLHEALGLTEAGLALVPPAPSDVVHDVRASARDDLVSAERCLPVFVGSDGSERSSSAWAGITIGADGVVRDAVVRMERRSSPDAERCAADIVARWQLPPPRMGGRVWLELQGRGAPVAENDDPIATKPTAELPGCMRLKARLAQQWGGFQLDLALFEFAVTEAGQVARFRVVSPPDLPLPIAAAVRSGVRACEWRPGKRPDGQPTTVRVILPVRFEPGD